VFTKLCKPLKQKFRAGAAQIAELPILNAYDWMLVTKNFTVYLVDDDPAVLKALSRLLRARGYDVKPYSSPHIFLEEHDVAVPGCVVLDVSMPGLDGFELQSALALVGSHRPVVFITGKGDIPTSVRAMKTYHRAVFAIAQFFQNILKVAGPSEPDYGQNGAACSLQIQV
jgi:response regulator RpfG family c-di-GMP phosphodiesterase